MSYFVDNFGDTFKVIRNYITSEEATELGKIYKEFVLTGGIPATAPVNDAYDFYNRPEQVALLSEKTSELNRIVGRKVLPAYSFTRQYCKGSHLVRHFDRDSCEISLSIHLYGDQPWAFCIRDKDGEEREIILNSGDAVLYDAVNAEHWREEYTGEFYIQTFHHYVLLGGKHEDLYFDNCDKDFSLKSFIERYRCFVPADICDQIVEYTEQYPNRWEGAVTIDKMNDMRVCDTWYVKDWDAIDATIFKYVTEALTQYTKKHPNFKISHDTGYQLLRYRPGGKYEYHTDQHKDFNREVTIIVNLNDDYTGGNLCHVTDSNMTQMGKGDIIIFPANFTCPHRITPVISGTRYSIVTWAV